MHTFITTEGVEIPIGPVNMLQMRESLAGAEKQFRKDKKRLDPPKYLIKSEAGDTWADYDAEAIKEGTEEEKAQWEQYIKDTEELNALQAHLSNTYLMGDGVKCNPANDEWEKRQVRRFIEIPTDPDKKKVHWVTTELLKTPEDIFRLIGEITVLSSSGIPEEKIAALRDTFRDSVLGGQDETADTDQEFELAEEGSVDSKQLFPDDENAQSLGDAPK